MTKAPFPWYGGKSALAGWIVKLLPPHRVYVEVFAGSAAVLFRKPRSHLEVWNDIDDGLVNFMRALRDEPGELQRRLTLTPHSRTEYLDCRASWQLPADPVERARRWYVTVAQSYSAVPPGSRNTGWNGEFQGVSNVPAPRAWAANVEQLQEAAARFAGVQVEAVHWRELFDRYDHDDACFYVDPPYVHDTRKLGSTRMYNHEMTDSDHVDLVARLLSLKAAAVVSGYDSELYRPLEDAGWQVFRRRAITRLSAGGRGRVNDRNECLWRKGDESLLTLLAADSASS